MHSEIFVFEEEQLTTPSAKKATVTSWNQRGKGLIDGSPPFPELKSELFFGPYVFGIMAIFILSLFFFFYKNIKIFENFHPLNLK